MTHQPSVWCSKYYFFFHNFLQNSLQKLFQFIFLFFYKFTKIKIKSFECPKPISNYKKNNAWNIRRLVNDSFVPANQRTSVLYCRLSHFRASARQMIYGSREFTSTFFVILRTYLRGKGDLISEGIFTVVLNTMPRYHPQLFNLKWKMRG